MSEHEVALLGLFSLFYLIVFYPWEIGEAYLTKRNFLENYLTNSLFLHFRAEKDYKIAVDSFLNIFRAP